MTLYQQGITLKSLLENPDLLNPPKKTNDGKKDAGEVYDAQAAFLGPQLWDKTVPYDGITTDDLDDFKLEFMDLDEFLTENEILDTPPAPQTPPDNRAIFQNPPPVVAPIKSPVSQSPISQSPISQSPISQNPVVHQNSEDDSQIDGPDMEVKVQPNALNNILLNAKTGTSTSTEEDSEFLVPPQDVAISTIPGHENFDPRKRAFTDEELRPQPLIKKSRKIFVPEESKDDKYWCRRKKNNLAAKRSRDARRVKENQIAMRASYLEKQTMTYKAELEKVLKENIVLKERLAKYEPETS